MTTFRFSKTALQALPLPEAGKRETHYDSDVPKLALRVTASGARTFYVVRRAGASMAWVKLGSFPDMTVEQARGAALEVLREFASGANPTETRRALRGELTLRDVFNEYLKHKRKRDGTPLAESTKGGYKLLADGPLAKLMPRKLSEISNEQVARLHMKVGAETPFMANRAKALISALYTYARARRWYSGENPADGVQGYAEPSRDRFARADELPHLLGAIAESQQRDFFLLALLTGARRSNVCAMRWAEVDFAGAVWRVGMTKNGTPQNVTLSAEAVAVLRARKEALQAAHIASKSGEAMSPFVFPSSGQTGHLADPKRAWARVRRVVSLRRLLDILEAGQHITAAERAKHEAATLKSFAAGERVLLALAQKAKIEMAEWNAADLRIHDLRRTLGSWQAMTGASMAIIGKSLNHKSQQSTAIYARLELDPVRQSVNTATAAMLEAAGLKVAADVVKLPTKRSAA